VVGITGLSKVTIWRKEKSGNFPKRINLTSRRVGWIELEIMGWLEARPRGICAGAIQRKMGIICVLIYMVMTLLNLFITQGMAPFTDKVRSRTSGSLFSFTWILGKHSK